MRLMPKTATLAICAACLAGTLPVSGGTAYFAYHRGVEAGFLTSSEAHDVGCATGALGALGYLRSNRPEAAIAVLDSTIDSGIASHWRRLQVPTQYADYVPPAWDLVEVLAEYRKAHPSSAAPQTPNLNRSVAQYLAHRDERQ